MTAAIATYEATVKRLTVNEALEAAEGAIVSGDQSKLPFPKWVSINYLKERFKRQGLGASDHSIMYYREIAFQEVKPYQDICLARYPDYWTDLATEAQGMSAAKKANIPYPSRKRIKPDKLPLTADQAEILEVIAELMVEWGDHLFVRDELNKRYEQPD